MGIIKPSAYREQKKGINIMTKEYKQAYQEIDKQIQEDKLEQFKKEVKAYKLEQLELQEKLKDKKAELEEKLRIVKLNLDNLDKGNFDAIEERIKKSERARQMTAFTFTPMLQDFFNASFDPNWTNGTYRLTNGKTFYF